MIRITSLLDPPNSEKTSSPLRIHTNHLIQEIVGSYCAVEGKMLDIGCGKGNYSKVFEKNANNRLYVGIDIERHPEWRQVQNHSNSHLRRCFVQMCAENIDALCPVFSFALTSCSLEHIEDDVGFVRALYRVMLPGAYTMHIVPSTSAFFLYGYHGWRRYSARRLSRLFKGAGFEIIRMYRLGGLFSFLLHMIWITWLETGMLYEIVTFRKLPNRIRRLLNYFTVRSMRQHPVLIDIYFRLLKIAIRLDRWCPYPEHGYALLTRRPEKDQMSDVERHRPAEGSISCKSARMVE
jgi:SAM-dependent methyltransferase